MKKSIQWPVLDTSHYDHYSPCSILLQTGGLSIVLIYDVYTGTTQYTIHWSIRLGNKQLKTADTCICVFFVVWGFRNWTRGGGSGWGNPNPRGWRPRVLDKNFAPPERVWVSQHRPDAEGSISILTCLQSLILAKEGLGYKTQTLCARTRLMHYQLKFVSKEPQVF